MVPRRRSAAYRRELPADQSASILRHIAGCPLCHDLWKRFELDAQIAEGIQCAIRGDTEGADAGPGWGPDEELPETLEIPGFDIRPGYIEGGQARVYRGTYEASQEEVAVKVFHNSLLNEGGNERFAREIKSLARLRHPNVITIRSDGQINGHPYFVMPWIEGLTLDEYVRRAPLPFDRKVDLLGKICDAVSHAHQRGVMHLDLKPTNVRVDAAGEPIVMDFGLARLTEIDYSEPPGMPAGAAGTPLYMAPEQVDNRDDLDVRADVYSLGLLIYEVLVGRRAKGAKLPPSQSAEGGSLDVVREVPPPPREVDPKVPGELEAITRRAIEVERDRRYQTAGALYEDLQNFREGRLVNAKAHQPWYRLHKWMHQYRSALTALGLILILMAIGVASRMYLNKVALDQWAQVYAAQDEANKEAVERERERVYELNRTRRDLIAKLEVIGALAERSGDSALADKSYAEAERIRKLLGGDELARELVTTQPATSQPIDSSEVGPDPETAPADPSAGRED